MTDIVERLRVKSEIWRSISMEHPAYRDQDLVDCLKQAAAEIERLRKEVHHLIYCGDIIQKAEIEQLRGEAVYWSEHSALAENAKLRAEIDRLRGIAQLCETASRQQRKGLQAEIERLRVALMKIASTGESHTRCLQIAQAALNATELP